MTSLISLLVVVVMTSAVTQASVHLPMTQADKQRLVDKHNEARQAEPADKMPDLVWNNDLAKLAQSWTDKCKFAHQTGQNWGENLAAKSNRNTDNSRAIDYMVGMWVNEKSNNPGGTFSECCSQAHHSCCHYTQVIWADTKEVGCGMTLCPTLTTSSGSMSNAVFLACYYDPPGNHPVSRCTFDWSPYVKA